jgi:hypothetical protein
MTLAFFLSAQHIFQSKLKPGWETSNSTQRSFLQITTSEKKNVFLLIETYRKLFNAKSYGHLGSILGGHFLFVRVRKNFVFLPISNHPGNAGG